MKVIWTRKALTRLTEVEDYIAHDSPVRAAKFASELMDCADTLAEFPAAGRIVTEDETQHVRELLYAGYRILYKVNGEAVYVLSVFEGSRLLRSDDLK